MGTALTSSHYIVDIFSLYFLFPPTYRQSVIFPDMHFIFSFLVTTRFSAAHTLTRHLPETVATLLSPSAHDSNNFTVNHQSLSQ